MVISFLTVCGLLLVMFVEPPSRFWAGRDEPSGDRRPTWLAIVLLLDCWRSRSCHPVWDIRSASGQAAGRGGHRRGSRGLGILGTLGLEAASAERFVGTDLDR